MTVPPREIEIKLDGDPAEAADLRRALDAHLGPPGSVRMLQSLYFDTPGRALRRRGLSLRIRTDGAAFVQTVKRGDGASAGLFGRDEWETAVAQATHPDLHAARHTPVGEALEEADGPLGPVYETRIERTAWLVRRPGGTLDVALDRGEVVADGRSAPLLELEIELKQGTAGALFALLEEVGPLATLRIGVMAKSQRGDALLARDASHPAKAEPLRLSPGMTTAAAARTVMHGCLRQFRRNEALVVEARDPEALHQARVGLRRLRSALSVFKPVLADEQFGSLSAGLKAVSQELGEARNLDVYLAHVAAVNAPGPGADGAAAATFLADMRLRREEAYDRLAATLRDPAFRLLTLRLLAWIEAGPWGTTDDPLRRAAREQPITAFAAAVLDRRRRQIRKKGRRLDRLAPEARHKLRIAAKKLRYTAEFVGRLAGKGKGRTRYKAFIDAMSAFQADLGDLNDIQTGHDLAQAYAAGGPAAADGAAVFAAGEIAGGDAAREQRLLASAKRHHRAMVSIKPFWRAWPEA